jgi:hypothetical protein
MEFSCRNAATALALPTLTGDHRTVFAINGDQAPIAEDLIHDAHTLSLA